MHEPGFDRPRERSEADVTHVTRGITVTAYVAASIGDLLVVRPMGDTGNVPVSPGDPVEVFWAGEDDERTLPARIAEVEEGEEPRWHLTVTGPAERSQRRSAVRAQVELPVVVPWLDSQLTGWTVDLSEAGLRALVDGWGLPPEPGTRVHVMIDLGNSSLDLRGEIVWQVLRGAQWLLAMRFHDLAERDADVLRRRVFAALRAERAAAR